MRSIGVGGVRSLEPVRGGSDTLLWRVETETGPAALRVFRAEQDRVCEWEMSAMRAASLADVPVPEVLAHGIWEDRPALLLSWCSGLPILRDIVRQPWRAQALGRALGRTQARIHQVTAPEPLQRHPNPWLRQLDRGHVPLRAALAQEHLQEAALLHLDFHLLNVMSDGSKVTAVLDWANARSGDPRIDVARTASILRLDMGQMQRPWVLTAPLEPLWRAVERGWREGYEDVRGPIRDMEVFYAAAGVFMLEDLADRYPPERLQHVVTWTDNWMRAAGLHKS